MLGVISPAFADSTLAVALYQQINVSLLVFPLLGTFVACVLAYYSQHRKGLPPCPYAAAGVPTGRFPMAVDVAMLVIYFLLTLLGSFFLLIRTAEQAQIGASDMIAAILGTMVLYTPFVLRWLCLPSNEEKKASLGYCLALIIGVVLSAALLTNLMDGCGLFSWLSKITGSPEEQDTVTSFKAAGLLQQLILSIGIVVLAPITEEITYRGFLYPCIKRCLGVWPGLILSGLIFGAVHMSLPQMLPLTLLGILLAYSYERGKTLWVPGCFHLRFNGLSVISIIYINVEAIPTPLSKLG